VSYFRVTTPDTSAFGRAMQRFEYVHADYFRIEGGALVFRNSPRGRDQYPRAIHVFAAGAWSEVVDQTDVKLGGMSLE
jgi:hypothetical protein